MTRRPLTAEEQALVQRWGGLAVRAARQCYGYPDPDAIAEGMLGLCHAVLKFDPTRNVQYATYASYWARAYVMRHWMNERGTLRVGRTVAERRVVFRGGRARHYLETVHGGPASDEDMAHHLGVPEAVVASIRQRMVSPIRLGHEKTGAGAGAGDTWEIPDDKPHPVEADDLARHRHLELLGAVNRLNGREQRIMRERWMCENGKTLAELAAELGISRERVRQIEEGALGKLRAWMRRAA